MCNCLNCGWACRGETVQEVFCMAYVVHVHIPLDDTKCVAYTPKMEEES